ncbi:uncharacterized protein LOC125229132 [Leguminivora glycinivorella]|uniref:uncharacterized protein LOC125229132 n=1 Tax=Leguminivora glycinivorella TaxID=1035111 RepID=UPI00200D4951|nr:uncharacterized protein LOC125229132 [Leguminivora glycinivorella]
MDGLIEELTGAKVGCHIGGTCLNNISYADDMVLLAPSVSALRRLVRICELYAERHGLRYNTTKSELLVFRAGNMKLEEVPPVELNGAVLDRVQRFKYLGHWLTEILSDDIDVERERRALAVRCNMLVRRFAKCSNEVKITLFKSYCQSFYTCSLWASFTQRAYNALRIQYNNAFRILMGLPRYCSASGMFADAHTDDFYAIMRKRAGSQWYRLQGGTNGLLNALVSRIDSPLMRRWSKLHEPYRSCSKI